MDYFKLQKFINTESFRDFKELIERTIDEDLLYLVKSDTIDKETIDQINAYNLVNELIERTISKIETNLEEQSDGWKSFRGFK